MRREDLRATNAEDGGGMASEPVRPRKLVIMNRRSNAGGAMAGRRRRMQEVGGRGGCGAAVAAIHRGRAWGASYRPLEWSPEAMRALGLPVATELEMSCENEATREAVERLTVAHFWTGEEEGTPSYSPEEAGLTVVFFCGRWFLYFRELEDAECPYISEAEKVALFRASLDVERPFGLAFHRC
jgi:hypothetical protein